MIEILATWRITNLLTAEAGPFAIFHHFRRFMNRWDETAALVSCNLCVSIWAAAIVLFMPRFVVRVLAISGGACLIYILLDVGWKVADFCKTGENTNGPT